MLPKAALYGVDSNPFDHFGHFDKVCLGTPISYYRLKLQESQF